MLMFLWYSTLKDVVPFWLSAAMIVAATRARSSGGSEMMLFDPSMANGDWIVILVDTASSWSSLWNVNRFAGGVYGGGRGTSVTMGVGRQVISVICIEVDCSCGGAIEI